MITIQWKDRPSTETPINAENLNKVPISFAKQVFYPVSAGVFTGKVLRAKVAHRVDNIDATSIGDISNSDIFDSLGFLGPNPIVVAKKATVSDTASNSLNTLKSDTADTADTADTIVNPFQEKLYDIVIKTDQELDTLLDSPDWLGAESVLFIGSLKRTINETGVVIPSTVKRIKGLNGAHIQLTNPNDSAVTYGFGYENLPNSGNTDYSIEGIKISLIGPHAHKERCVFYNCLQLIDCNVEIDSDTTRTFGFSNCENLLGCSVTLSGGGVGSEGPILYKGFDRCTNLINCSGRVAVTYGGEVGNNGNAMVFSECESLMNCTGTLLAHRDDIHLLDGAVFSFCEKLTNCQALLPNRPSNTGFDSCKQIANCVTETSHNSDKGYFSCSYGVNNRVRGTGFNEDNSYWSTETNDLPLPFGPFQTYRGTVGNKGVLQSNDFISSSNGSYSTEYTSKFINSKISGIVNYYDDIEVYDDKIGISFLNATDSTEVLKIDGEGIYYGGTKQLDSPLTSLAADHEYQLSVEYDYTDKKFKIYFKNSLYYEISSPQAPFFIKYRIFDRSSGANDGEWWFKNPITYTANKNYEQINT